MTTTNMTTMNISDTRPAGYDLFFDNDKDMDNLSDSELERVIGGTEPISAITLGFIAFGAVVGAGGAGYGLGRLLR